MQQAAAHHFRAGQVAELELEAHGEQQQQHAQVRQVGEDLTVLAGDAELVVERGQGEPGAEVADQRRQADDTGQQTQSEGEGDPGGFDHGRLPSRDTPGRNEKSDLAVAFF